MNEPIIISENSVAYLPEAQALVNLNNALQLPATKPDIPLPLQIGAQIISWWGDDNLFPQNAITDAYKTTIIPRALEWKAKALYSGGLVYGKVNVDDTTGEETMIPMRVPAIDQFFKLSAIKKYLREAVSDFYWFGNVFSEMILSMDRSQILELCAQEATYSRWEQRNVDSGMIENCYLNANWGFRGTWANSIKVPVIDTYYDAVNKLKGRKEFKYIYGSSFPTPNRSYYQCEAWDTLRQSGWINLMISIPKFKAALMKNQITIKYHLEIHRDYWKTKWKDWESLPQTKKIELMQGELKNFNSMMQGENQAGMSLLTAFYTEPASGKEVSMWKITAIDDKMKSGIYIEDSQEASSHAFMALGVDPTLIGVSPGKGMGAGSGSDKRVAFNIYMNNCKPDQDIIVEPLEFIRDYNGWDPDIQFWFRNYWISTLDQGAETKAIFQAAKTGAK